MTHASSPNRRRPRRAQPEPAVGSSRTGLLRLAFYGGLVLLGFALGVWVDRSSPFLATAPMDKASPAPSSSQVVIPTSPSPRSTSSANATATIEPIPDVAIVAGHYSKSQPGNAAVLTDPGTVCSDGLKEVDINLAVAQKTLALLAQMGYRVTLFEEFDSRLKDPALGKTPDFRSRVFLSIHSNACVTGPNYPLATGWKVAHAEPSDVPEADDRLVRCIKQGYSAAVKPFRLVFNENTITPNMTAYHSFRSIVPTTPAAIIELGFLSQDREILTRHQDELAQGLANGLQTFLQGELCTLP